MGEIPAAQARVWFLFVKIGTVTELRKGSGAPVESELWSHKPFGTKILAWRAVSNLRDPVYFRQ